MKETRSCKKQRGQSLVEMAISFTLIIFLLTGAIDFGIAFFSMQSMRDAAEEGAIYGSLNPDDWAGIEERVRKASVGPVDLTDTDNVIVEIQQEDNMPCAGKSIMVVVTCKYQTITPGIGLVYGDNGIIPLRTEVKNTILVSALHVGCPGVE